MLRTFLFLPYLLCPPFLLADQITLEPEEHLTGHQFQRCKTTVDESTLDSQGKANKSALAKAIRDGLAGAGFSAGDIEDFLGDEEIQGLLHRLSEFDEEGLRVLEERLADGPPDPLSREALAGSLLRGPGVGLPPSVSGGAAGAPFRMVPGPVTAARAAPPPARPSVAVATGAAGVAPLPPLTPRHRSAEASYDKYTTDFIRLDAAQQNTHRQMGYSAQSALTHQKSNFVRTVASNKI